MTITRTITEALENKKGENILVIDLQGISMFTDYFIICSGTSDRMLSALADSALDAVRTSHRIKGRREGDGESGWLLIDFGNIILHLFSPEKRDYYRLEELWSSGKVILKIQ